jgi:hypothetical protein
MRRDRGAARHGFGRGGRLCSDPSALNPALPHQFPIGRQLPQAVQVGIIIQMPEIVVPEVDRPAQFLDRLTGRCLLRQDTGQIVAGHAVVRDGNNQAAMGPQLTGRTTGCGSTLITRRRLANAGG